MTNKIEETIDVFPLGERIRYFRTTRGLTQSVLSKRAGISQGFLAQVEKSQALPSLPVLYALARELDVAVAIFFATDDVLVLDIKKLVRRYGSRKKWSPAMKRAFHLIEGYLEDIAGAD